MARTETEIVLHRPRSTALPPQLPGAPDAGTCEANLWQESPTLKIMHKVHEVHAVLFRACAPVVARVLQAALRDEGPDLPPRRNEILISIELKGASVTQNESDLITSSLDVTHRNAQCLGSEATAPGMQEPPACHSRRHGPR